MFPGAIENLIRQFDPIDEFQVRIVPHREMYELDIQLELAQGEESQATQPAIESAISEAPGLLPKVAIVPSGRLPGSELKAKRFHVGL